MRKNEFYPGVKQSFVAAEYEYYDGDEAIKGKTRQHRRQPDYVANLGITYDLPFQILGGIIRGGYTVPFEQAENVAIALKNCGKNNIKTIADRSHSATFIFDL